MKRPVIGVTPMLEEKRGRLCLEPGYFRGIETCGGLPVMLPLTTDKAVLSGFLELLDGVLFTGGHDIFPALYRENVLPECGTTSLERDDMETFILREALRLDLPVFGICRGIQLINATLGGTLYQDMPSQLQTQINHQQERPYDRAAHEVRLVPGSPLHALLGIDAIRVNSLHHQCIKDTAPGATVMARSPDGLVEAIYLPEKRFVWAVQWHPEFTLDDESSSKLFRAFTDACRG